MADEKIIFSMVGVSKTFTNQKKVLNNIYLSFFYGAKIGIIGLNGSGKSTLMKIIAGIDKNFQGEVVFSPGYTVGYLEQEPKLDDAKTVREVVEEGCASTVALLKEYEEINQKLCEPMDDEEMARLIERQGELYEQIDHVNGWELDSVLERAMDALRCPDPDQSVKVLSGGERRRVALCRLLLQQPDVLLLDEPTNHLDAESIDWLEQHLQQYKGTVIAVTHDRYFLDNVAGWILELDRGEGIPWKGNYSGWLEQKTTRMAMEEKQESKRRKTLERELEWVRMSPSGRHAKSKARLSAYDKLMNEDTKQKEEKLEIFIPNGPRLGDVVIEAHDVSKAFGDRVLYEGTELLAAACRYRRCDRPQRYGQDYPLPDDHGTRTAYFGNFHCRSDGQTGLRGSAAQVHRPGKNRLRGDFAGYRPDYAGQPPGQCPRLRGPVQFHGRRSGEEVRHAVGRRAQPPAPGPRTQGGR